MLKKFIKLLLLPISFIIIIFLFLVRPFVLIRFGLIPIDRIGHLAANPEICNEERIILENINSTKILDIFGFTGKLGNKTLIKLIKRKYVIFPEYLVDTVIFLLKKLRNQDHQIIDYAYGYDLYNLVYTKKISHQFKKQETIKGYNLLEKINIYPEDKIVTLFIRDESYNKIILNEDDSHHDYRNSNIQTYQSAANYLSNNGYKVIRMGRKTKEIIIENKNIVDYSFSNIKSDFLDIFISSISQFFLTTNTGMESASTHLFKKKGLVVNFLPYLNINFYKWVPYSILLPKKIKKNGRFLTFSEIFSSPLCGYTDTQDYLKNNLEVIDNNDEEILEATKEYVEYQLNKISFLKDEDIILQKKFWDIYNESFNKFLKYFPRHKYYKKNYNFDKHKITSIVSPYFLKKYSSLLK